MVWHSVEVVVLYVKASATIEDEMYSVQVSASPVSQSSSSGSHPSPVHTPSSQLGPEQDTL